MKPTKSSKLSTTSFPTGIIGATGMVGVVGVAIVSGLILASSPVSADDSVVDQINITVPVSCTMSGTGMNTHNANIENGTYTPNIGTTTLHAFCNDNEGFALYAIGYTDNEYGKNVLTSSTLGSTYDIATGIATSGNTSNWAMKLAISQDSGDTTSTNALAIDSAPNTTGGSDTSFSAYHTVPNEYTKVAHKNSATDMTESTGGVKLTTTYAAFINATQPAGTYTGQVKYTLVHPALHTAPDEFFGETLQSVSNWSYKVDLGQTVTVTDARDGEEYTVARLADGKLWMTKNLRLDLSRANITVENTNNPTAAFLASLSSASSSDEWCTDSNATCTDQIKYNTSNIDDTTLDSDNHTYDEYGVYYNWYTATAGNGTYDTALNTTVSGDICPIGWHLPTGTDTSVGSPSVWVGDFWDLAAAQDGGIAPDSSNHGTITGATGSERLRSSPNNFLYSGYFAGSSAYDQGAKGYYWASSKYSNNNYNARIMNINSTSAIPGYNYQSTHLGASIRCVAGPQSSPLTVNYGEHVTAIMIDGDTVTDGGEVYLGDGIHSASILFDEGYVLDSWVSSNISIDGVSSNTLFSMYSQATLSAIAKQSLIMQEVDDWGDSVLTGQTVTAYDSRDNSQYTVARLADGKLWMTKNMRLNIAAAYLTADNTNNPTASFLSEASSRPAASLNSWCSSSSSDCNDQIQYSTINIGDSTTDSLGHTYDEYGIYYNWYTATAGNGTRATPERTEVAGDICPAGWHLPARPNPSMYDDGDFYNLAISTKNDGESYNSSYNVGRFINSPINLVLSGSMHNSQNYPALYSRTSRGAYWESTKNNVKDYAMYWYLGETNMHDNNYGDGYTHYGNSIRCLAND